MALTFVGRLPPASFLDFVGNRAARLDLDVTVHSAGQEQCTVEVAGQPDLVGAFEMACSLGPLDCLVLDCRRAPLD